MIEELDMHLLDLVQNSVAAGATEIAVRLECDEPGDRLLLQVADDGRGMDEATLEAVRRGFYSSKAQRSVGLGLPLLREVAEHCDGAFGIESVPGAGTKVTATLRLSHIDRPPFGNLPQTFLGILVTSEARRVSIRYRCGGRELKLDTAEIDDLLGGVSIQHPEVIRFLQAYIAEHIGEEWEER
jgi:anti-sigma regulatory factor (Ser/Thr protein kinase)